MPSLEELSGDRVGAFLSHEEFAEKFCADSDDLARVKEFAADHGLEVKSEDAQRRTVEVTGTVSKLNAAFGITLRQYEVAGQTHVGHSEEISLPEELDEIVQGVLGLDDLPLVRSQVGPSSEGGAKEGGEDDAVADSTQRPNPTDSMPKYFPPQVAALYDFPSNLDGTGECIGIVSLAGGYDLDVLKSYFDFLKIDMPDVSYVNAGAGNNYDPTSLNTVETMMDIEVAGSIAYGADIVVYFAEQSGKGFIQAVDAALSDRENKPSILSISFASPEIVFTSSEIIAFRSLTLEAALKGVTILVSSGDTGSNISATARQSQLGFINNLAIANFPTTDAGVLGCGGTDLRSKNGKIVSDDAWNLLGWLALVDPQPRQLPANGGATGGGVSLICPLPGYQKNAGVQRATQQLVWEPSAVQESFGLSKPIPLQGRGVPDVGANALGYQVLISGEAPEDLTTGNGTSLVAPLWAALLTLCNQGLGKRVGFLNHVLYNRLKPGALNRTTRGSNGAYDAHPDLHWNACTGLGVPNGTVLLDQLKVIYGAGC